MGFQHSVSIGKTLIAISLSVLLGMFPVGSALAYSGLAAGAFEDLRSQGSNGISIKQVSFETTHKAVVTSDGSLWMWGANKYGQIGNGIAGENDVTVPTKVMTGVKSARASGYWRSSAIKEDGSLWVWGHNDTSGVLGTGTVDDTSTPIKILDNVVEYEIGDGKSTSIAVTSDGGLWVWGLYVDIDQKGYKTSYSPVRVFDGVKSAQYTGSGFLALKKDRSLWAWGLAYYHELGTGGSTYTPTKVLDNVDRFAYGPNGSTAALKTDGSLWTWGKNDKGQLGVGDSATRARPTWVIDDVKSFSVGDAFESSGALKNDGSLWVWGTGDNYRKTLGVDAEGAQYSPVKALEGVREFALSWDKAYALTDDGRLMFWGGSYGITPTERLRNVTTYHWRSGSNVFPGTAIGEDRSLWGWGGNSLGEVGNGGRGLNSVVNPPVKVMDDVSDYFFSHGDRAAIDEGGALWIWGGTCVFDFGNGSARAYRPTKVFENGSWLFGSNSTVEDAGPETASAFLPTNDGWGFSNHDITEAKKGDIPPSVFFRSFAADNYHLSNDPLASATGSLKLATLYALNSKMGDGGLCHGLALSSALTFMDMPVFSSWIPDEEMGLDLSKPYDLKYAMWDFLTSDALGGWNVDEWLQSLHASQLTDVACESYKANKGDVASVLRAAQEASASGKLIAISVSGLLNGKKAAHTVVPYAVSGPSDSGGYSVRVYDSNHVLPAERVNDRAITFATDSSGNVDSWSFEFASGVVWSSATGGEISYYDYPSIARIGQAIGSGLVESSLQAQSSAESNDLVVVKGRSSSIRSGDESAIAFESGSYSSSASAAHTSLTPIEMGGGAVRSDVAQYYFKGGAYPVRISNDGDEGLSVQYVTDETALEVDAEVDASCSILEDAGSYETTVSPCSSSMVSVSLSNSNGLDSLLVSGVCDSELKVRSNRLSEQEMTISGLNNFDIEAHIGDEVMIREIRDVDPTVEFGIDVNADEESLSIAVVAANEGAKEQTNVQPNGDNSGGTPSGGGSGQPTTGSGGGDGAATRVADIKDATVSAIDGQTYDGKA
ncbi:MAG: hypothetical protein IJ087_03670, partial [Eggerthellaceae bacterium]|nr:hypothetical protein [Eggerthellaceae bacterium]